LPTALSIPLVWSLSTAHLMIEAAATVAFALSGAIIAERRRPDAVGVCVVAGLAAFGGGAVCDVLLDRRPLFWVEHHGCVRAVLVMTFRRPRFDMRGSLWAVPSKRLGATVGAHPSSAPTHSRRSVAQRA
jgi:hypothetical protein